MIPLAWVVVAGVGLVTLTQTVGYDGFRFVATLQSLTPYLGAVVAAPAVLAAWRSWHAMGLVSASIGIALLLLAVPLVVPPDQPSPVDGADGMRIAAVNLLFSNDRTSEVADVLATLDLDVIVFSEFTAEHQAVLSDHELADRFPHRIDRDGLFAGGVAVWSRHRLVPDEPPATVNYSIDARVDGPDGVVRVLAVHPPTPIYDFDTWRGDIELIGDAADSGRDLPTLVIGDFNASYWHPVFRRLLRRGWTDAHMANGRGWSTSWPTDRAFPPFIRLDHALTGKRLVSTDVEDFRVPGSDHAGLVVTVSPAR